MPRTSKARIQEVLTAILALYPDKQIELIYETPFQLLIAVMLSAQTTDKQVNRVTPEFFALVREPEDLKGWNRGLSLASEFLPQQICQHPQNSKDLKGRI